jgi:hypothetical protein
MGRTWLFNVEDFTLPVVVVVVVAAAALLLFSGTKHTQKQMVQFAFGKVVLPISLLLILFLYYTPEY